MVHAALGLGCGGGSPTGPTTPGESYTVSVVVFYDQNGNGTLDSGELARVPEVEVQIAGRSGRSATTTGRVAIAGVPKGEHSLTVRAGTLPPFWAQSAPASVAVPQTADASLPLVLPIGTNVPNLYMGFGDSITTGEGSSTTDGYKTLLQARLQQHLGAPVTIADEGLSGSKSERGAERIGDSLARVRPAYTLILYGTNDWHRLECKTAFPCFTIDSLTAMVRSVKASRSLPVLATILPLNPASALPERNEWVTRMNDLIRPLARQEGAVLVDLHAAFVKTGDLTALFVDQVHPNDRGYGIIADEFFGAITRPGSTTSATAFAESPHDLRENGIVGGSDSGLTRAGGKRVGSNR